MNMKSIKHIMLSGTVLFLTALSSTSCTDGNDWNVDSSYDRLFGINAKSLTVDPDINTVALEWTNTNNTDYYVIEVSKDSLTDDVKIGESNGAIVFGEDKSITTSPETLTGLDADTKYFIRMKGMSDAGKGGSNWVYYKSYSFKTKTEQIIDEDAVTPTVTATTATIFWDKTKDVSLLKYVVSGATDTTTVELSAEDKAAGSKELTGLKAKKTYLVTIYNGTVKRGSTKFTTAEELAPGYDQVDIASTEVLQDVLENPDKYIKNNGGNIVLVFSAGTITDFTEDIEVSPKIKSLQFFGRSGGDLPVLNMKSLSLSGHHETVRFYNMKLQSDGSGYAINQKVEGSVTDLSIENCEISSLSGVVRSQNGASEFTNVSVKNCKMSDIGQYGIVQNSVANDVISNVSITNTTVSNGDMKGVVITKGKTDMKVLIESCTFYNALRDGQYVVDDNKMPVAVTLSKVILAKNNNIKATRTKKISTVTDTYTLSDFVYNGSYDFDGKTTQMTQASAEIFVDPDNSDFHIQKNLITNAGDPRWLE